MIHVIRDSQKSFFICTAVTFLICNLSHAQESSSDKMEFFERKIRPVLVEHCYECHNSADTAESDLAVDFRNGLLNGGVSGASVVRGEPNDSLLLRAMRHQDGMKMPKGGPKLSDEIIDDFAKWIADGAVDPRETPPDKEELAQVTSWENIRNQRMKWWSFQPLQFEMPDENNWSERPIDRFIYQQLVDHGVEPQSRADKFALLRRLSFVLTGLPPSQEMIDRFSTDSSEESYEEIVDELMNSPHFGERWARHWMDLFRYAESHGSEGDPGVPYAFRYRDYLIRALNSDVPYNQMVREHIAGDLLETPRVNDELQINESAIGVGHFRFVQHGYSPVDPLAEQIQFTDNQIDVVSKAFLGLTISCARCHNHKFDPISQKDYYKFYGIFANSRPALITVDTKQKQNVSKTDLARLKSQIKSELVEVWLEAANRIEELIDLNAAQTDALAIKWRDTIVNLNADSTDSPFHELARLRTKNGDDFTIELKKIKEEWAARMEQINAFNAQDPVRGWDLSNEEDYSKFVRHGSGLNEKPTSPGDFVIAIDGDSVVENIFVGGAYTNALSNKHNGVIHTPEFPVDYKDIWIKVAGLSDMGPRVRFAMENYPRFIGLLYYQHTPNSVEPKWFKWDMSYFSGNSMYIETTTGHDIPVEIRNNTRSWFGLSEIVCLAEGQTPPVEMPNHLAAVSDLNIENAGAFGRLYSEALMSAIKSWAANEMTDEQALFLSFFARNGLLPNSTDQLKSIQPLIAKYREIESGIPVPTRSPGVLDRSGVDHALFERGNHKTKGPSVPRGFLEAFGDRQYETTESGRRELSSDLVTSSASLLARVAVNRMWHHLFGSGLVSTPDNFGKLGRMPSHPQLLDFLAKQFIANDWSQKSMIKSMVLSKTFQQQNSSQHDDIQLVDSMFGRYPIRRLDAESIRDSILSSAGTLEATVAGGSVLETSNRRSVYVRVHRNNPDPFLETFNRPDARSTVGNRPTTNVPAQSLTMLNGSFVVEKSRIFAAQVLSNVELQTDKHRIIQMYRRAFSRNPTAEEIVHCVEFLEELRIQNASLIGSITSLDEEIGAKREAVENLLEPIRKRLMESLDNDKDLIEVPKPVSAWDFETDFRDQVGNLHGTPFNGAKIENGSLVLTAPTAHVKTVVTDSDIRVKTLEALVQLDRLNQGGGGVITVQTPNGLIFDSIVYGERISNQWIAGSDGFRRTEDVEGLSETEAHTAPVHMTIVYSDDGTITIYRNGELYGQPYKSNGPVEFKKGTAQVVFGLRHGTPDGNKLLDGRILDAKLYDKALSRDEIEAIAAGHAGFIPEKLVLAELSVDDRERVSKLRLEIGTLSDSLAELSEKYTERDLDTLVWREFAQSLFNLKEFIFLR